MSETARNYPAASSFPLARTWCLPQLSRSPKRTEYQEFYVSQNGRLVVSKVEPEPNGTSCNLWITATGSEALRRLTDWQGSCLDGLTLSSDGSTLALRKYSPLGTTYIAELLQNGTQISSPVRFNYNKGQQGPQAWLHDSQTVLLASSQRGHWEILKAGSASSSERRTAQTRSLLSSRDVIPNRISRGVPESLPEIERDIHPPVDVAAMMFATEQRCRPLPAIKLEPCRFLPTRILSRLRQLVTGSPCQLLAS